MAWAALENPDAGGNSDHGQWLARCAVQHLRGMDCTVHAYIEGLWKEQTYLFSLSITNISWLDLIACGVDVGAHK